MVEAPASTRARLAHDGKVWRVYYFPVEDFESDLRLFGEFLESLDEAKETVSAIVPNMGFVRTSIVLGTSFQGVKGFAVIAKKHE